MYMHMYGKELLTFNTYVGTYVVLETGIHS